jgi:FtsP/CotA-like multicopper oxidase with cupredoxin domain
MEQQFIEFGVMPMHNISRAQRQQAAADAAAKGLTPSVSRPVGRNALEGLTPVPGGVPDYFGPYPNYATSQLPIPLDALGNATPGTGIRKFVDTLPGLTPAGVNNLGQYIPVAVSDTVSYPGSDYYELAAVQWSEKMHSDIEPTLIRGYVQVENRNLTTSAHIPLFYPNGQPILNATGGQVYAVDNPHYMGPTIVANSNVPVRFKLYNYLPNGTAGLSPIPIDETIMGAGLGPDGVTKFTENRVVIHLHGGNSPWISDGTPHQWISPANENTPFMKGASLVNVPDMDGGFEPNGTQTYYYTNQQSSRLMFYHDHMHGTTRVNVYGGEAAGYVLRDGAENGLIANGTIPSGASEIPLIIQDKSFIPNATQMQTQDPTWSTVWGNQSTPWPHTGDFWFPHVYMPLQNPADPNNVNAMGRWDYAPWAVQYMNPINPPIANPYAGNGPWEYSLIPAVPNPSTVPESFMDTPVVNGVAYPVLQVGPHAYRFRILNAANDRTLNLALYYAANNGPMWNGINLLNGTSGEVPMVPALPSPTINASGWPTDNRFGGVPDPVAAGPSWYQIGTEGGFMPAPAIIPARPIDYDYAHNTAAVLNIKNHSLLLMPAQRADVIVDFAGIPDGTKLILYNDAPAPAPGGDSRYDFFTGDGDQTAIGGAPDTLAGYGPNTRTIMQIQVNASLGSAAPYNLNNLNATLPGFYASSQEMPLVPQDIYNAAFGTAFPADYIDIYNNTHTFTPANGGGPVTLTLQNKAVIGDFEMEYGRLTALLGIEIRRSASNPESRVGYQYTDPPTEIFNNSVSATQIGSMSDGTQIWRVSNVDVDLHPLHWHMFNLQVLNRVRWDGEVLPPEPSEAGWRETVNIPPLMDTIVAMRPITPNIPWELPNSIRNLDPASPTGSNFQFTGVDPTGGQAPVVNHLVNFGWEYVYHCHILGHEENDFMRAMVVAVPPKIPPSGVTATWMGPNSSPTVNLSWVDNSVSETNWTIQRATNPAGPWTDVALPASATGPQTGATTYYVDGSVDPNTTYHYQVLASNWVGDITPYAWTAGYPTMIVNSTASNAATVSLSPGAASSLALAPGWNFIATPKRLSTGNNTAMIFAGVNTAGHSIWRYDAATSSWHAMIASDNVNPLEGYWIYSAAATTIPLNFDTNPILPPPTKALPAGWNAIGFSDVTSATTHETLISVNSQWSIQIGYDATTQAFETSVINGGTGAHADTRLMLPMKGYWLFMNQPGTLASIGV